MVRERDGAQVWRTQAPEELHRLLLPKQWHAWSISCCKLHKKAGEGARSADDYPEVCGVAEASKVRADFPGDGVQSRRSHRRNPESPDAFSC
eukprot:2148500-Pleurochrysis_carterae.AAC.1